MRHSPPIEIGFPFDLHVLGTPPAFILSQDQTLRKLFGFSSVFTILLLRCALSAGFLFAHARSPRCFLACDRDKNTNLALTCQHLFSMTFRFPSSHPGAFAAPIGANAQDRSVSRYLVWLTGSSPAVPFSLLLAAC